MLALAHGAKGIQIWKFATNLKPTYVGPSCEVVYWKCLAESLATGYRLLPLGDIISNNIAPRLKGKLGKTLLHTYYTGNYLQLKYINPQNPVPEAVTYDYLTIGLEASAEDMNWHAGFLKESSHPDNNYFLLVNLLTSTQKTIRVKVTEPVPGYENYSFRNVEKGYLDTTFKGQILATLAHPAGEGYLYQVSPVVLYGGRMIYNEIVGDGMKLYDEMTIENGATLSISGTYHAYADIIVKNGGKIVNYANGKIEFLNGAKLIVEGNAFVYGFENDTLVLDFKLPDSQKENGIVIKENGSLNISYCKVLNALYGINAKLNFQNIKAEKVAFENCGNASIYIIGQEDIGYVVLPEIKYCNITNSPYGISALNLSEIIIQNNRIKNTSAGIFLSNISNPYIIGNTITAAAPVLPGIIMESCNGFVRSNLINGHTEGIYLGNSSPSIGGNTIWNNLYNGIYIGPGSYPYMRAQLAGTPPLWYAISGYNQIKNNGGWNVPGPINNDGSEIYFQGNANAYLSGGCNEITDQREPEALNSPPLVNTRLLMNGSSENEIVVYAEENFWDEHPLYALEERFGNLIVYYEPYLEEPCPTPQSSDQKLLLYSSRGEVVDVINPLDRTVGQLSETELLYAEAEAKFISADYNSAGAVYNQIIASNQPISVKLKAYQRLYEIGKLTSQTETYFDNLYDILISERQNTDNKLYKKILNQLGSLSLIGKREIPAAIEEFDLVIQQNPNTTEAVYAEIDAITASLLMNDSDSTLMKGAVGKYFVKGGQSYFEKLNNLLINNFSSDKEKITNGNIPEDFSLYQNYPNPFNPVTKIKYAIPIDGFVSLSVYNLLGEKVADLVSNYQKAGFYEISFDASNLASGLYIYHLKTENYSKAMKMILLK